MNFSSKKWKFLLGFFCIGIAIAILVSVVPLNRYKIVAVENIPPAVIKPPSNGPKLVTLLDFSSFEKDAASAVQNWLKNQQPKYGGEGLKKEESFSNRASGESYKLVVDWLATKLIHVKMTSPNGYPALLSFWLDENGELKLQSIIESTSIAKTATGLELQFKVTTKGPKTDEAYGLSLGEQGKARKIVIGNYQGLQNFPITFNFEYPGNLAYLKDKKVEIEIFGSTTAGF